MKLETVEKGDCPECNGRLSEDPLTGFFICDECGIGWTNSGKRICKECVNGNCSRCESWRDGYCKHECLLQERYGPVEEIGFITDADW